MVDTDTIRWGILSTGKISRAFAEGLRYTEGSQLVAVGSRTQSSADAFAKEFSIPRAHPTYEALAADPEVDVIYISTPHPMHKDNTILCLNHGKHVLCEKPFAMTAAEAAEMIAVAREKKLFLMEAMWTRYLPLFVRLRQMLNDKVLGEVRLLQADFGFSAPFDEKSRLFAPELGGGALLDVGIYPVSLASLVFGTQPQMIASAPRKGTTGVDEHTALLFGYTGDSAANIQCATRVLTPCEATIAGDNGYIRIHSRWFQGQAFTFKPIEGEEQFIAAPIEHNGYRYEAAEVVRCLREGKLESSIMPLDETLAIMQTMDKIQQGWTPPQTAEAQPDVAQSQPSTEPIPQPAAPLVSLGGEDATIPHSGGGN